MIESKKKISVLEKTGLLGELFLSLTLMALVSTGAAHASDITPENVIKLVNGARNAANVAALKKNALLQLAAEKKAQDMIDQDYFAHVSPQGNSPWDFISEAGYDYRYAGENLAINFTDAKEQQKAWMDSPLHRKNILNSDYQEIGVAVKQGVIEGHKTTVTVQEFGTQMAVTLEAQIPVENKILPKETVAGAAINLPSPLSQISQLSTDKASLAEMKDEKIFRDNALTLKGWSVVFAFAILLVVIDVAALFHKKHEQLVILQDARKRSI